MQKKIVEKKIFCQNRAVHTRRKKIEKRVFSSPVSMHVTKNRSGGTAYLRGCASSPKKFPRGANRGRVPSTAAVDNTEGFICFPGGVRSSAEQWPLSIPRGLPVDKTFRHGCMRRSCLRPAVFFFLLSSMCPSP